MSKVARQNLKGQPKVTGVSSRKGNYATYVKSGESGSGGQTQSQGLKGDQQKFGGQTSSGSN